MASRSSKLSSAASGWRRCSSRPRAIPARPSSRRRSVVGWVSIRSSSMVVAAAADVAVLDGQLVGHGFGAIGPVQAVAQDRLHRAVGAGADVHAALAGCLQALRAVAAHQAQDAETGPKPLLRMRL